MVEKDISQQVPQHPFFIDQVGLSRVELPLSVEWQGSHQNVLASFDAVVSLNDPQKRGIHMSRIYLILYEFSKNQALNFESIKKLAYEIKNSQRGISFSSRIRIDWKGSLVQKALSSSYQGVLVYPCFYEFSLNEKNEEDFIQGSSLYYSSTCPCSASLSRDLIQKEFEKSNIQTKEEMKKWLSQETSLAGVPHAQRSRADFKVRDSKKLLYDLIRGIEETLTTVVQSAVKREDEMEFARLNAQNLLYSEDAIRRIKHYFEKTALIQSYWAQVSHFESLHPFDTIAQVSQGWKD